MPKRILDSSMLSSPSLAKCSPRAQDAWPRFLLLMDDFGCADATPRVLLGAGWPLRDDVSERDVWAWLEEYVGAGMACLWTENERRYVHLTGWFGPHGQRHREEYDASTVKGRKGSKRKTPAPPAELVAAVAAGVRRDHDGKPPGIDREDAAETCNDSVPARETKGSREIPGENPATTRRDAAPAVADAVPVAEQIPPTRTRARLVSGLGAADPCPQTTAVLAALYDRGLDAAPPGPGSAARVEAAIVAATIPVAAERLAAVYAVPGAKKPLTFHVEAIRGETPRRRAHGDLGAELIQWNQRLSAEDHRTATAELRALARLDPDLEYAPLGVPGNPDSPAYEAVQQINAKWRAVAEARP